jgi:hypothetical protein
MAMNPRKKSATGPKGGPKKAAAHKMRCGGMVKKMKKGGAA